MAQFSCKRVSVSANTRRFTGFATRSVKTTASFYTTRQRVPTKLSESFWRHRLGSGKRRRWTGATTSIDPASRSRPRRHEPWLPAGEGNVRILL